MTDDPQFHLNRRDFLKWTGTLAGAGLLAACQRWPANIQLAFCLHDYQLEGVWNHDKVHRAHPLKKAKPETVTTYRKDEFVELTPDWQWFWYRNLIYCAFGHFDETRLDREQTENMHKAWLWLIKGTEMVTNRHGPQTHWEVITGTGHNTGKGYIAHDGLLGGGNIIRITGPEIRLGGQSMYPFESLDGSRPPPGLEVVNAKTRPDLLQRATISHYELFEDGTTRVDPFPHLEKYNAHTVFLNISIGQNYVPTNRVALLDGYRRPNPYNPERTMAYGN
jgi:hypothetical protein